MGDPNAVTAGTVLLLEDDPMFAALVCSIVEHTAPEFGVAHVVRLSDALGHLASGRVDVIITDLNVPDSRGVATVSRLRAAAPRVPILVLSGVSDPDVADDAQGRGADDYVLKSRLSAEGLTAILRRLADRPAGEARRRGAGLGDNSMRCR